MSSRRGFSPLPTFLIYAVLIAVSIVVLTPFAWLVSASFKNAEDFFQYTFLPTIQDTYRIAFHRLTLINFDRLFREVIFQRYLFNSLFVASTQTFLVILFASMAGFALAKYNFRGKRPLFFLMLASMMIPVEVLLAPNYELLYYFGWLDEFKALIIPASISVFAIFLYRQTMIGLPDDLLDAGRVDGCSDYRIYWDIALRLSRPMTGAITLVTFLFTWNSYLWPQIVLRSTEKYTLPILMSQMLGVYEQEYGMAMAGTFLSFLPVVILFFILQREFISGLTLGAMKQ